mmetsp:Transcript_7967/g.10637  ORF Transcript_7967/g.10637 Transcript_7967/m.10637 type:complete len:226 (+) Transcript_7967:2202-2879(+)
MVVGVLKTVDPAVLEIVMRMLVNVQTVLRPLVTIWERIPLVELTLTRVVNRLTVVVVTGIVRIIIVNVFHAQKKNFEAIVMVLYAALCRMVVVVNLNVVVVSVLLTVHLVNVCLTVELVLNFRLVTLRMPSVPVWMVMNSTRDPVDATRSGQISDVRQTNMSFIKITCGTLLQLATHLNSMQRHVLLSIQEMLYRVVVSLHVTTSLNIKDTPFPTLEILYLLQLL